MSDAPVLRLSTPGDREIVIARDFRAPRQRVFDAYTKPDLLRRWFGSLGGGYGRLAGLLVTLND